MKRKQSLKQHDDDESSSSSVDSYEKQVKHPQPPRSRSYLDNIQTTITQSPQTNSKGSSLQSSTNISSASNSNVSSTSTAQHNYPFIPTAKVPTNKRHLKLRKQLKFAEFSKSYFVLDMNNPQSNTIGFMGSNRGNDIPVLVSDTSQTTNQTPNRRKKKQASAVVVNQSNTPNSNTTFSFLSNDNTNNKKIGKKSRNAKLVATVNTTLSCTPTINNSVNHIPVQSVSPHTIQLSNTQINPTPTTVLPANLTMNNSNQHTNQLNPNTFSNVPNLFNSILSDIASNNPNSHNFNSSNVNFSQLQHLIDSQTNGCFQQNMFASSFSNNQSNTPRYRTSPSIGMSMFSNPSTPVDTPSSPSINSTSHSVIATLLNSNFAMNQTMQQQQTNIGVNNQYGYWGNNGINNVNNNLLSFHQNNNHHSGFNNSFQTKANLPTLSNGFGESGQTPSDVSNGLLSHDDARLLLDTLQFFNYPNFQSFE